MGQAWIFSGAGRDVAFVAGADLGGGWDPYESVAAALVALDHLFLTNADRDGHTRLTAVEMLERCGHSRTDLALANPSTLLEMLRAAVRQHAIVLRRAPLRARASGGSAAKADPPPAPPERPAPPPPREKPPVKLTYVSVKIAYDDGTPYTGPFRIKLTDGTTEEGTVDGGMLEFNDIPPGTCEIELPDPPPAS